MAPLIRNMTKMFYLRFHDKISAIIQYLFGIIIHLANIFNIQQTPQKNDDLTRFELPPVCKQEQPGSG